jgi:DNA invertase Pin-like site-specific DNA recombinase
MTTKTAIIYLRVSTDEQGESGLGLEAQERTALDYCDRNGLEVVEIVREVQSGKSIKKRLLLQAALERCAKGEASVLVASNVSRLARSIRDLSEMLETAEKRGYGVAAVDTGLDTSTPAGKMVFQILGVAAEYERAMISDRTKKALAVAKANGVQVGRPSQLEAATLKVIQTQRAEGKSYPAIANHLNAQGVSPAGTGAKWHPSTVRKALISNGGDVAETISKGGRPRVSVA